MHWIHSFQLFLFDFDGLLVNTEHLHFQAYRDMLAKEGFTLNWTFAEFCQVAHLNAVALKEALYAHFPQLNPNWSALYEEKKRAYLELLMQGKVELMPGAKELLQALEEAKIRRCVVTNSLREQIDMLRGQIPVLQTIPHWITREDYSRAKPDPDGYVRAIELYGKAGDRIIGFEDSVRGIQALKQTPALPVLICQEHHPLLERATEGQVLHFNSLQEIALPSNALA